MGGKVWSAEEEQVFWRVIIPQSQKRAGRSQLQTKSWEDLAIIMQSTMSADAKRSYTGLGLFEHYFANIEKRRLSPNATKYVREYKEALERAAREDEEEETEVEDDDFDENATISDHSLVDLSHTGETTEDEVVSDSDIYEDKENRPFSSAREPLAPLPLPTPTYGPSRPAIDPVANLRITFNFPRRGLNSQFQTSGQRDTLRNELTRDPPDYGFGPQHHANHYQRSPAMSHERDASNAMPEEQVPAHMRGRPEDYEEGGRYWCLPTPDYRYITPEEYAALIGPVPGTNHANFTLSRETRPSTTANLSFGPSTVTSPDVAFAPGSESPARQSNQQATSAMSQSPSRDERNLKSRGKTVSQQSLQPGLKRSYEHFSDDESASPRQEEAPPAPMSPTPAYAAPVAEMNPNPADSYPAQLPRQYRNSGPHHPRLDSLHSLGSSGVFAHTTYNPSKDKGPKPEGQRPKGPYEGPIPDYIMRSEPAHVQNQHRGLPEDLQETEEDWLMRLDKGFQYYEMPPPPPPAKRNFSQRPPAGRKD